MDYFRKSFPFWFTAVRFDVLQIELDWILLWFALVRCSLRKQFKQCCLTNRIKYLAKDDLFKFKSRFKYKKSILPQTYLFMKVSYETYEDVIRPFE